MKPIPRISTRGYYDLSTGKTLKKNHYYLYPKKRFHKIHRFQRTCNNDSWITK